MDGKTRKERQRRLIREVEKGRALIDACEQIGVPRRTVESWRQRYAAFEAALSRALDISYDVMAERLATIGDGVESKEDAMGRRLNMDGIKWLLERRARAKYSPQLNVNVNHQISVKANLDAAWNDVLSLPGRYPTKLIPPVKPDAERVPESESTDRASDDHVESDDDFKL